MLFVWFRCSSSSQSQVNQRINDNPAAKPNLNDTRYNHIHSKDESSVRPLQCNQHSRERRVFRDDKHAVMGLNEKSHLDLDPVFDNLGATTTATMCHYGVSSNVLCVERGRSRGEHR